jgi:hypothetical protein
MGEASPVHRYYYSTYHLAGDFVWGVGIVSLFLALACILVPEIRCTISAEVVALDGMKSSSLVIAGIGLFALILAALSMVTHRIAVVLRDTIRLLPGKDQSIGFKAIYRSRKDDINAMYLRHFPEGPHLSVGSTLSPTEMVNRLSVFMKLYNPDGYNHHYRTYAIVSALRHSVFYTVLLGLVLTARHQLPAGLSLLALAFIFWLCLRFAVKQSVATEFDFIVATSRWILDRGRGTDASSPDRVSTESAA